MVGDRPGQYTTGMYRDGPLAGRWWWRRNTAAGEPANPKLVNDHPDVVVGYRRALAAVRADIHGPADESEVEAYTGPLTRARNADAPLPAATRAVPAATAGGGSRTDICSRSRTETRLAAYLADLYTE